MGTVVLRAKKEFKPKSAYFPKTLPTDQLEWPSPSQRPVEPTKQPLGMYLIPGLMMALAVFIPMFVQSNMNQNPWMYLTSGMSFLSSIAMAGYYWWSYRRSVKEYQQKLQERRESFQQQLRRLEEKVSRLAQRQKQVLEDRYPSGEMVLQIALSPKTREKRLWARHEDNEDFLALRIGLADGAPSFTFQSLPSLPPEDKELEKMMKDFYQRWQRISDLPLVVPLRKVGSMVVMGRGKQVESFLYRIVMDLAVHHSPRRLRIGVITHDSRQGAQRWGWMRWLPHTRVLEEPEPSFLAFSPAEGFNLLDTVSQRLAYRDTHGEKDAVTFSDTIVLILDDAGVVRRSHVVQRLIAQGPAAGIFLIFVGDPVVPGVRAVVRLHKDGTLNYKAEIPSSSESGKSETVHIQGRPELLSQEQAEEAARAMLQLEPPEPRSMLAQLPDKVPLTHLLAQAYRDLHVEMHFLQDQNPNPSTAVINAPSSPQEVLSSEFIEALWQHFRPLLDPGAPVASTQGLLRYLLRFPLGLTVERGQLLPVYLNLLPEGSQWDGKAAYHTILIGPTGSGKSEFLKTLIWSGAYIYPPGLFNVFFLDFKGGAATEDFKIRHEQGVQYLPHLVGVVTNPGQSDVTLSARAISRRGIHAIRLEANRRETLISRKAGARDIWEYNEKVLAARRGEHNGVDPSLPLLPHLLIILDEFSKAVEDFPELGDILDDLVRRGRSFGMYLLLANQKVTPTVSRLLPNVGWRIGLRLRDEDLREVIPGSWPALDRVGRGYLMCVPEGHVTLFQSGWGGEVVREKSQHSTFPVYALEPGGRSASPLYVYAPATEEQPQNEQPKLTQGRYLTQLIFRLAQKHPELQPNPWQVYLEPLPTEIDLQSLLEEAGRPLAFAEGRWQGERNPSSTLSTPIGLMDNLHEVRYDTVEVVFHQGVGHLWVLGTATSGKEKTVYALLLGLAHRYTPAQVWFYLVEPGSDLTALERLPHTGAHVSLSHREQLARFVHFLKEEYEARKAYPERRTPRLVIVLHNYHRREWNEIHDEISFLVAQILKNGAPLGLHLVLTSPGTSALSEEDASALTPRLVLDLGKNENFWEAGISRKAFFELTRKVPGRGYWLERLGHPGREAQVAQYPQASQVMARMDETWTGIRPPSLRPLPTCLSWEEWEHTWKQTYPETPWHRVGFPVGLDFDHQPVVAPLHKETPLWMVVAPVGRGKTNLLLLWGYAALQQPSPWHVWYFASKAPKMFPFLSSEHFHSYTGDDVSQGWEALAQALSDATTPHLLLLDDGDQILGSCPETAATTIAQALDKGRLFGLWAFRTANLSRVSGALSYDHPFRSLLMRLPEDRLGFILVHDPDYLNIYGFSFHVFREHPAHWEAFKQPARGRGLWVFRDKWRIIQIPCLSSCEGGENS